MGILASQAATQHHPIAGCFLQDAQELKTLSSSQENWSQRLRGWLTDVVWFAGTLFQRTVIAEQNLISELYPYQEG